MVLFCVSRFLHISSYLLYVLNISVGTYCMFSHAVIANLPVPYCTIEMKAIFGSVKPKHRGVPTFLYSPKPILYARAKYNLAVSHCMYTHIHNVQVLSHGCLLVQ